MTDPLVATAPVAKEPGIPSRASANRKTVDRLSSGSLPFSLLIGAGTALLLLQVASAALRDIDLYWHLLAGNELLNGTRVSNIGADWSFAPSEVVRPWATTQWLSEVLLTVLHSSAGWPGPAAFRLVTAAVALAVLARSTLGGRPAALAAFPFLVTALTVALISQDRPQQFSLIGAAVLGGVIVNGLAGSLPRWWLLVAGTALWANLHGGWILVPASLLLVAIARIADHGFQDRPGRRSAILALLAGLAGTLTPLGPSGLAAVLRFPGATDHLAEWQPTEPMTAPGSVTIAMLLMLVLGWSRGTSPPRSEYLVALALLLFSWTAWRSMAPALLMLAPIVAQRLTLAFPGAARRQEPRWSVPVGIGLATAGLAIGLLSIAGREHLPTERWPIRLAERVASLPGDQRVLTDYNVSGITLFFGGRDVRTSIDGRADRYRSEYVGAHDEMMDLRGDWQSLLGTLDPTAALIEADSALAQVLVSQRGWSVVQRDGDFVLLVP